MQNWYPAAGTGTDTVQVPVQTADSRRGRKGDGGARCRNRNSGDGSSWNITRGNRRRVVHTRYSRRVQDVRRGRIRVCAHHILAGVWKRQRHRSRRGRVGRCRQIRRCPKHLLVARLRMVKRLIDRDLVRRKSELRSSSVRATKRPPAATERFPETSSVEVAEGVCKA